jgi:hypothetical protein
MTVRTSSHICKLIFLLVSHIPRHAAIIVAFLASKLDKVHPDKGNSKGAVRLARWPVSRGFLVSQSSH